MSPASLPEQTAQERSQSRHGLIVGLLLAIAMVPVILWLRGATFGTPQHTSAQVINPVSNTALPPADLSGNTQFLDDRDAFKVSANTLPDGQIRISFLVANGYYLYRDKIGLQASEAALTDIAIPQGEQHRDQYFGDSMVLRNQFDVTARMGGVANINGMNITLRLTYQGCADDGICYPPIYRTMMLDKPA